MSIWIIRGPISTLNILKQNHAGHIFGPDQTRHTTLSILTDQKNYQEDKCKISSDYFVLSIFFLLITKLINIRMIIPTRERWKVDAFVKISAFSSTALVLVFDWSKSKSNGRNLNFQFAPSSCQIVYITTLPHWTFFFIKNQTIFKETKLFTQLLHSGFSPLHLLQLKETATHFATKYSWIFQNIPECSN